ncbi:hypothetical protein BGX27_001913 [Mortierella sp. AM989]|nr:hypothetical protein BGX27_001913 [Mortierella sp. AM989]
MLERALISTILLLAVVLCSVISTVSADTYDGSNDITLSQLEAAFAGNCPTQTKGEVISCRDALPYINSAIRKYGFRTRGQRAAYIATMAYEGGYLKYNHNLVTRSQGTRSILPATSLRVFVNANEHIQELWPNFPSDIDNDSIVDVLIHAEADFEPGAWWTVSGPGCSRVASRLSESESSFVTWETTCINGGKDTIAARTAIYNTVYASIL